MRSSSYGAICVGIHTLLGWQMLGCQNRCFTESYGVVNIQDTIMRNILRMSSKSTLKLLV